MHGEVTVVDALKLIEHRTAKDRNEGFANLKNIIRKHKRSNVLKDANVHYIYETLFRVAIDDRTTYLKASTPTTRSAAENRLSACASTLRRVIEDTVRFVKIKTLRAALDHITHLFAEPNGAPCEPLALEYTKALAALLGYQPHAEHLSSEERERYTMFCVRTIENGTSTVSEEGTDGGAELNPAARASYGQSYRSSRSHYKYSNGSHGSQSGRSLSKQVADEMMGCLALLGAAPNGKGTRCAERLAATVGYLQTGTATTKSQQDALVVINQSLTWSTTQDLALTQKTLSQLLRLLQIYWPSKAAADTLKDEMLISYIYLRPYIISAMRTRENITLRSELSAALSVIRSEYAGRLQRNQLNMEDIRLSWNRVQTDPTSSIETPLASLRCAGPRAEGNWAAVDIMAFLSELLMHNTSDDGSSGDEDDQDESRPRKRQRLTSHLDELIDLSIAGSVTSRITALQTLCFLAQRTLFSFRQLARLLDKLSSSCADDNADVSSWALLAIASFALQKASVHSDLCKRWASTWQLASRSISNAVTSRPACHLLFIMMRLRLAPTQSIADFVHTMTVSMDLNGPSVLADSVTELLTYTVQVSQQTTPTTSVALAESALSWLFRTFTPSRFVDKEYAGHQAFFEPDDIVQLIAACLGKPLSAQHNSAAQFPSWNAVGQAWLHSNAQTELIEYLLLLPRATSHQSGAFLNHASTSGSFAQSRSGCETMLLNNLASESFRMAGAWSQATLKNITHDMFIMFCKACQITCAIAFCSTLRDSRRQSQLQKQAQGLLHGVQDFAKTSICSQNKIDAMLITLSSGFVALQTDQTLEQCQCELVLCTSVVEIMEGRLDGLEASGQPEYDDLMDMDDDFDSQESRRTERQPEVYELPNDNAVAFGNLALRANMTVYATIRTKQRCSHQGSSSVQQPSSEVLDTIFSLPDAMIFAGRHTISSLSHLGIDLSVEDATRLADFCMERLELYQFERSEVALGAILDIMASITSVWTNRENAQLYEDGLDMYSWYILTGFPNNALSSNVQCRLASLLLQLCHVDLDYGQDETCPSARTSIFELISKGSVAVQFHLAGRISALFGLFVLSNHPLMFDDLREILPKDTTDVEGIAIRLLFLSRLASAWHSLLRECVFYIVETAGQSKSASKFATHCISELAAALHFDKPQKLFRLFAPQLLYSWLDGQSVDSLPYAIFKFDSLDALVIDNLSEITAQLFTRGKDQSLDAIISMLKTTKIDLLKRCLAKVEAYSISHDISKTPAEAESRLRTLVGGKDQLNKLLVPQYPAVIAQFFLSAQNEDVDERWLEKRAGYSEEANALKEMRSYSYSDRPLPACQQPSFKSKWLGDQIERLSRRVGKPDPASRWDPSAFAFVARTLLDSIDSALGPLHTCLVIRRLRILICLAGEVAITDYQLEMLISALRPCLNDSQCADDAMGVLQYLFRRGQTYLKTQLPFVCGTITLMILQIRKHSTARQESTTQESQHKATIGKMRAFHNWLVEYMKSIQPRNPKSSSEHTALVQSLAQAQLPGNARRSTPQSTLLLMLLGNGQNNGEMFRAVHREEALIMLSENFETCLSVDEDCLSEDADCMRVADQLWYVARLPGLGKALLSWAASALGRAYAASGRRPHRTEQSNALVQSSAYEGTARSQAGIAGRLVSALYGDVKLEASIADRTLRDALLSFDDPNEVLAFESMLPPPMVPALQQSDYGYAPVLHPSTPMAETSTFRELSNSSTDSPLEIWVQRLSIVLCQSSDHTAVLPALIPALRHQPSLGTDLLPMIVHILLAAELEKQPLLRAELSACVGVHLAEQDSTHVPKQAYLLRLLLYLRAQALPGEHTQADRLRWLEVDWLQAAGAAVRCKMYETALLMAESATATSPSGGNRRSSSRASMSQVTITQVPQDLLLSIFKGVDEPDSFYGVEQPASLDAVLNRFDFEVDGFRSLMFRSAQTDTHLVRANSLSTTESAGMVRSLSMLNLNCLTFALLSSGGAHANISPDELLNAARKLQQWDIVAPEESPGPASSCFTVLQELSRTHSRISMLDKARAILLSHLNQSELVTLPGREWFGALAALVEVQEVVSTSSQSGIRARWELMQTRQEWMHLARFDDVGFVLSNRQILFSTLVRNENLLKDMRGAIKDCRCLEVEALLNTASFAREHNQLQQALSAVYQAGALVPACEEAGLRVDAAVKMGTASVLWDSSEATASVKMMRETLEGSEVDQSDIEGLGRAGLLARLAHQLGEARLETPDNILAQYLQPAIEQLHSRSDGLEAGEVFHEFATFCDKQLQNPGSIEDFERIATLRQKKLDEVNEFERLVKMSKRRDQQDSYYKDYKRAKQWFEIDDAEYQRLKRSRDIFMQQSLQNYMLTLRATNKYNISVLRLFALWLENAEVPEANHIASKFLSAIPSWKFVLLMNQLMSRLESDGSQFQKALSTLLLRICSDHPHHSLHHLFATTRKPANSEQAAASRHRSAMTIRSHIASDSEKARLLDRIFTADKMYKQLAEEDARNLPSKASIKDLSSTEQMRQKIPGMRVPPITLHLPLLPNGDYSNVPSITRFGSTVRLMSGLSRPKMISVYASDGQQYQQLFKSGNDDLRQDAIMEQVFEEVSKMLRNHKATRQRNLVVRTYKVIPLNSTSGAIEFVPNSMSFSDFLKPAHDRYYPKDYKESKIRGMIGGAKEHSTEVRITEFRKVCDNLHPVMRHFFFERFSDPDEWFQKRTAYTRTTATISILGYVVGLGDRHCQNIMLDEKTGEVVHIDLGVAFEAGRVLPIPELVPFRLSRDVVDGMGITKTEGVFRRCCEFTMDALREDKDSIMTLLNVLRYDPLYTWSVSPLRAKRMQEETGREQGAGGASKKKESEAGEADRALSIVEKKLSKTLSTAATVNELIQQATDERNLATLFVGWAAWY